MEIFVNVADKIATPVGAPVIICGNSDYTITFSFDSEWDERPVKTARFNFRRDGKVAYKEVVFSGEVCEVPILSDITEVKVGVYAGDLQTTTPARIECKKSILCGSDVHEEPPEDIYNQLTEEIKGVNAQLAKDLPSITEAAYTALENAQEAEQRAASVKGVYVGSGEMPEGYTVQIDPDGAVYEMDSELDEMSVNPVSNSAIAGELKTISAHQASIMNGIQVMGNRVTAVENIEAERNKVLWEGTATVGEGTNSSVAIAAIGIENYSVISVDGRIYTKDEASNSFNSMVFERALYDGENETIALDIRKIWYGQSMAVIRSDAEVDGRDRVDSHIRLFWLLDVDALDSGITLFEYPSSFSVSKIIGIM